MSIILNSIVVMTIYVESFNLDTVTLVINPNTIKPITINVNTSDSIAFIKHCILENIKSKDKLCLVNSLNRSFNDERTLSDYNIQAESTILAKKFF
jgi:hypothetical protein